MIESFVEFLSTLSAWQVTLLVLGTSFGTAVLLEVVGVRFARAVVRRTPTEVDNIVFRAIRWPVIVTAALGGIAFWVLVVPQEGTTLLLGQQQLENFLGNPAASIVVLVWAYALNRIVNQLLRSVEDEERYREFAPVFSNVFTLVVAVGALFLVLRIFGIEITPLLGAAGVAGIAVGFAAKDTVANFFGGLALYFDDTYKIGDYVELDSGEAGTVVKVGVRSTTLMTRDEVLVTLPNSVLNNAKIINQSAPDLRKRIRIPIGIAYGTDVDRFEELILEIVRENDGVLDAPKPRMRFRQFGDSALEYELLCWVRSPTDDNRTIHQINREVYKTLNREGIEIPYPQRDVTLSRAGDRDGPEVSSAQGIVDGGVDDATDR